MKKCIGVLVVLATIIIPGIVAKAQIGTTNSVTISTTTPASGQVTVGGTYTIASGYTFSSITALVEPNGGVGGQGGLGTATPDGNGNFTATIPVPAGTYDVQVYMTVTDTSNNTSSIFSNTEMSITVPN